MSNEKRQAEVFQHCDNCKAETSSKKDKVGKTLTCTVCENSIPLPTRKSKPKKAVAPPTPEPEPVKAEKKEKEKEKEKEKVVKAEPEVVPTEEKAEKPKTQKRVKAEVWDIREYDGVPYQKHPDGRWMRYHG
jgi:hypothetical protein